MNKKTTIFENGLIWFGAGLSIAEILTGTYFASMGFKKAVIAIIIGHIIGCSMLFLAGVIGGKNRLSAMESVKNNFGRYGGRFFALLNVLQLVGWTAIMIYDGAIAANGIALIGHWAWCMLIGGLIIFWIIIGITNIKKINVITMSGLFVLTLVLCKIIFIDGNFSGTVAGEAMSFGGAVELAAAMPLSWMPLIGDYTSEAEKPVRASAISVIVYGSVSCWMYIIGMGTALFTEESDIAQIMLKSGLGIAGLIIIVLSTVTTTFLDAYSAGISGESVFTRIKGKHFAIFAAASGMIFAILFPMENITGFLYLLGSVFAPMIAVQVADEFILHREGNKSAVDIRNIAIWSAGFIIYRILMNLDLPTGNTLPDMVITVIICLVVSKIIDRI